MKLGEKIKIVREIKNYSQEYMALRLGITQQAYCLLEQKDSISDVRLNKIAEILEIDMDKIKQLQVETIFNQYNNDNAQVTSQKQFINQQIQNEEYIQHLKEEINYLKKLNEDILKKMG